MSAQILSAVKENAHSEIPAEITRFTASDISECLSQSSRQFGVWCQSAANEFVTEGSDSSIFVSLLDLALSVYLSVSPDFPEDRVVANEKDAPVVDEYAEVFLSTLQNVLSVSTVADAIKLIEYLEKRLKYMIVVSSCSNSILILQIVRSALDRLNPGLYFEARGRLIQFIAICKGYPHPSRLNKRGKVYEPDTIDLVIPCAEFSPGYYVDLLSKYNANPEPIDIAVLKNLEQELEIHVNRLKSKKKIEIDSSEVLPNWNLKEWSSLSNVDLFMLALQVCITFRNSKTNDKSVETTFNGDTSEQRNVLVGSSHGKDEQILSLLKMASKLLSVLKITEYAELIACTEDRWKKWKEDGCNKIEKPTVPCDVFAIDETAALPELPELIVGGKDSKLNQLFETNIDISVFKAPRVCKSSYHNDIAYFSKKEEVQPDLSELEKKLELQEAESRASIASASRVTRPTDYEPEAKRARISYEDTQNVSFDRQRARSNTLKPMPY